MKILSASPFPDVSPNVALTGTALTLLGIGAVIYVGPKAVAMAGLVGGCLFAAATANVVLTGACQLAVDGYNAIDKAIDERKAKPAGRTIVVPETKVAAS
jgi:hypothetical protein